MNTIALLALVGGALLLMRPDLVQALTLPRTGPGGRDIPLPPDTPTPEAPGASTGRWIPVAISTAGTLAGAFGGAGAGAAALGLSGALMATGIGAGVGILAWGITSRGWFRGGSEALHVNGPRDEFKALFAHLNPYRSALQDPNGPGFFGLAWLLHELGRDDMMAAFNRADTRAAFESIVADIDALLDRNVAKVAELATYARAHFPLDQ